MKTRTVLDKGDTSLIQYCKKERRICDNIIDTMEHVRNKQKLIERRIQEKTKERK